MHPKASKYIRRATYKKMAAARQRITNAEDADREESERLFQLNRQIEADRQAQQQITVPDSLTLFTKGFVVKPPIFTVSRRIVNSIGVTVGLLKAESIAEIRRAWGDKNDGCLCHSMASCRACGEPIAGDAPTIYCRVRYGPKDVKGYLHANDCTGIQGC